MSSRKDRKDAKKTGLEENIDTLRRAVDDAVSFLRSCGVIFDTGLSDSEVEASERRFGFRFPPDLRAFLQTALPVRIADEDCFPNWRSGDRAELQEWLERPFKGIAFDIEQNEFWWHQWGPKPERIEDAIAVARQQAAAAPTLIPIFSHRFIAAEPSLPGNPVFSVHQTDIIFYGTDLWDYFRNEFGPEAERWQHCRAMSSAQYYAAHRMIPFWTELVRWNEGIDPERGASAGWPLAEASPAHHASVNSEAYPQLLAERLAENPDPSRRYMRQWWRLGHGFIVNVNRYPLPNVFVNLDDLDMFWPLRELGFLEHATALGLDVITPHGVGHNCFKMPAEHLDRFLLALRDFFAAHADALRKAATQRSPEQPKVKDWRKSWWYNDGGVGPYDA